MAMESLRSFFLNLGSCFMTTFRALCQCGTSKAQGRDHNKQKPYRRIHESSFDAATNYEAATNPASVKGSHPTKSDASLKFGNDKFRIQGDNIKQRTSKEKKPLIKQTTPLRHDDKEIIVKDLAKPLTNDHHRDFENSDRDICAVGKMSKDMKRLDKDRDEFEDSDVDKMSGKLNFINLTSESQYRYSLDGTRPQITNLKTEEQIRSPRDNNSHIQFIHSQRSFQQKQPSSKDRLEYEEKEKRRNGSVGNDQKPIPKKKDFLKARSELPLPTYLKAEDSRREPITHEPSDKDSPSGESSSPKESREVRKDAETTNMEPSLLKLKDDTVIVDELHNENEEKRRKSSDSTDKIPIPKHEDSVDTRSELSLKSDLEDDDLMKKPIEPITNEPSDKDPPSVEPSSKKKGQEGKTDADTIVIPVPLKNPRGYCFFNSVVQILFGCRDFVDAMIAYPTSRDITSSQGADEDKSFVINFCDLLNAMKNKDMTHLNKSLEKVHESFTDSNDGDDVQNCFMKILTWINNATRTPEDIVFTEGGKSAKAFNKYKSRNKGFIFDLFYGQMSYSTTCNVCKYTLHESFQLFKSLPLPVLNDRSGVTLENCIDCFFQRAEVVMDKMMDCKCENGSFNFFTEAAFTHSPKYLFIYLNRGSYFEGGLKNNTFVQCPFYLDLATKNDKVPYKLISVIDHIGNNECGHYYCKCNYDAKDWWLISDEQVENLDDTFDNIISKHAIVLMYKKRNV